MDFSFLIPLAGIGIGGLAIYLSHQRQVLKMKLLNGAATNQETIESALLDIAQKQAELEARINALESRKPSISSELPTVKEHLEQLKTAGRVRS